MKKFLSILLTLAMCFSLICISNAEGEMNIVVDEVELEFGETEAVVEITIPNNPGIALIGFNVDYDSEALTLETAELVDIFTGEFDHNIEAIPFVFNVYTGSANKTASGTLVKLTFAVNENCEPGIYDITIDAVEALNIDEEAVPYEVTNGYVKVNALPIEGVTFKGASYTYDGAEKEIKVAGTLPEDAEVSYENNKATAAGTYEATATITAPGYEELTLDATLEIKAKELTIKNFGAEDKTYDGTTDATLVEGELVGVVGDDDVEAVYPEKGTFASKDAKSTAIAVSYDEITLDGEDAGNYTLKAPGAIKAKIAKATLIVKANDIDMVLGQEMPELTYEITEGEVFAEGDLTGAPATKATGTKAGTFDITKGTLKASANYNFTFENGTLTISEKLLQNVEVAALEAKTYGDEAFVLEVTDGNEDLGTIAFASSNTDVAEIAADGTVTIKAAGETEITVSRAGNDIYADFAKVQTLVVDKVCVTVNVTEGQAKRFGTEDPAEFAYTYEGTLVGEDAFTGALAREEGEEIGFYNITIGTLAINDNYNITFNGAKFEITAKTPQEIAIAEIPALTYGDAAYTITVTKDETSNLEAFVYESDNTAVLTIENGVITIVGAGEATIKVTEPGNEEYAEAVAAQKVTVAKKDVVIEALDIEAKTVTVAGAVGEDVLSIDFDAIVLTKGEETEAETVDVTVTGLVLTGDVANYNLTTESFVVSIAKDAVFAVTAEAENGTVEGAGAYLAGAEATLKATANRGYKFIGWYAGEELVSEDAEYTFLVESDVTLTAMFERKSTGSSIGGDDTVRVTVKFETNGGSVVDARKVNYGETLGFVAEPVREGYEFKGWFVDEELTEAFDAGKAIKKDITLYASWKNTDGTEEDKKEEELKKSIILTIGEIGAKVFGEDKNNDVAPLIKNDRTMLPARFVAEALGAEVAWDEETRVVTITKDEIVIVITIDAEIAVVNGEEVKLDSPAFIENDRTYTPIRFISENLGAEVAWDEATQKVTIKVK